MTFEQIKELVELIDERGLGGLEIERSGFRLKIDGAASTQVATVAMAPAPAQVAAPAPAAPAAAPTPAVPAASAAEPVVESEGESALPDNAHVVTSPIVGTFYAAPSPDDPAYVRVGDRVEAGKVLCIVEAMKLMNEIESDVAGEILEIYPKNGQPVEFGEPLFAIGTA